MKTPAPKTHPKNLVIVHILFDIDNFPVVAERRLFNNVHGSTVVIVTFIIVITSINVAAIVVVVFAIVDAVRDIFFGRVPIVVARAVGIITGGVVAVTIVTATISSIIAGTIITIGRIL